jgi:hypothetical protein
MKLVNGMNKLVKWDAKVIQQEAGFDTGMTSIVTATCDDGTEVTISQHEAGEWDVSLNEETTDTLEENEGTIATQRFMRYCQLHNK